MKPSHQCPLCQHPLMPRSSRLAACATRHAACATGKPSLRHPGLEKDVRRIAAPPDLP